MESGTNFKSIFVVLAVGILAIACDTTNTWVSPMYQKLYSTDPNVNPLGHPITKTEDTWLGSIINIGAMLGPFPFGYISGRFGRKIGLLVVSVPFAVSYAICAFAQNINFYFVARLLAGLAVGGSYTLMPTYVTEITEESKRGMMSSLLNCFWMFGNLIPFAVGPYLPSMWFNLLLAALPALFFLVFLFTAPESPYYLMHKKGDEAAENSLKKLRPDDVSMLKRELQVIKHTVENEKQSSYMDIFRSAGLRRALFYAVCIVAFQQWSGIKAFMYYVQFIFQSSGSTIPPEINSIIFGAVAFGSSFLAPVVADKWPRRVLMAVSSLGTCLALSAMGTFFYLLNSEQDVGGITWLPITSIIVYMVFFNLGLGSVAWTLTAELFPSHIRPISASLISSACWIAGFLVTNMFNRMKDAMGEHGVFWFFAGSSFVCALFSMFVLPETKGKTFEEIQSMLQRRRSTKN